MGHKGHYGEYTGNAKWSKVTNSNMGATKRDDEAHMKYLKEDIDYDNKHGHSDSSMTSDEKHISKLAGDLKYDEKKHGSVAKMVSPLNDKSGKGSQGDHRMTNEAFARHKTVHDRDKDTKSRIKEKAEMLAATKNKKTK